MALKAVSWNCKVGRDKDAVGDALRDIMDDHNPSVICLQEAKGYAKYLRDRFGDKWYVYYPSEDPGWDEDNANPVMVVKKNHEKQKKNDGWGWVRYQTKWTGPQGGVHKGRTWVWVNVKGHMVMSLHRATGGKDENAAAFEAEYEALCEWMEAQGSAKVLVFGDHNCGPQADFPHSTKRIRQAVDGDTYADAQDKGIDYALTRNYSGTVKRTKPYGSDHDAMVWTGDE